MSRLRGSGITQQKWYWTQKQVDLIDQAIQKHRPLQELVFFHVALDTMLRISDLLILRTSDLVLKNGNIREVLVIKQKKTNEMVEVILHKPTRDAIAQFLEESGKTGTDYLFTSQRNPFMPFSSCWARYLVKGWATLIGLPEEYYSCHTTRRTGAMHLYKKSRKNLEVVRRALGHSSIEATKRYLGVEQKLVRKILKTNSIWK